MWKNVVRTKFLASQRLLNFLKIVGLQTLGDTTLVHALSVIRKIQADINFEK